MSPFKLSLINTGNNEPVGSIDIDDDLVDELKQTIDADPDLTMEKALKQGVQAVVKRGPRRLGQTE